MLGDISIPIETRKNWVWEQVQLLNPEFKRENFSVDDPYMLHEIVARNCYRYKPLIGDRVLDLGANIGIFTALCALNGCTVVAYEPNQAAFKVLQDTIQRNRLHSVEARNKVVWVNSNYCKFLSSVTPPTGDLQTWTSYNGAIDDVGEEMMPCDSFEEIMDDKYWDCVKMDIEGAEFEILMSTPDKSFHNISYLTIELHNGWADKRMHDCLIRRLQHNFTVTGVKDGDPRFAGEDRWISLFCKRR